MSETKNTLPPNIQQMLDEQRRRMEQIMASRQTMKFEDTKNFLKENKPSSSDNKTQEKQKEENNSTNQEDKVEKTKVEEQPKDDNLEILTKKEDKKEDKKENNNGISNSNNSTKPSEPKEEIKVEKPIPKEEKLTIVEEKVVTVETSVQQTSSTTPNDTTAIINEKPKETTTSIKIETQSSPVKKIEKELVKEQIKENQVEQPSIKTKTITESKETNIISLIIICLISGFVGSSINNFIPKEYSSISLLLFSLILLISLFFGSKIIGFTKTIEIEERNREEHINLNQPPLIVKKTTFSNNLIEKNDKNNEETGMDNKHYVSEDIQKKFGDAGEDIINVDIKADSLLKKKEHEIDQSLFDDSDDELEENKNEEDNKKRIGIHMSKDEIDEIQNGLNDLSSDDDEPIIGKLDNDISTSKEMLAKKNIVDEIEFGKYSKLLKEKKKKTIPIVFRNGSWSFKKDNFKRALLTRSFDSNASRRSIIPHLDHKKLLTNKYFDRDFRTFREEESKIITQSAKEHSNELYYFGVDSTNFSNQVFLPEEMQVRSLCEKRVKSTKRK
ncbi:hypothetical protein ABK040_001760 [Willaertia magna]